MNKILISLSPDYLILFTAYNNRISPETPWYWELVNFINSKSWFFVLSKEWIGLKFYGDIAAMYFGDSVFISTSEVRKMLKKYRDNLELFNSICLKNNIQLIVGTQPHYLPASFKQYRGLLNHKLVQTIAKKISETGMIKAHELIYFQMASMNFEMSQFAKDNSLLLFDGINISPEEMVNYFIDPIHFNKRGAKIQAENLFDFLIDKNVIHHLSPN